jgi:uncharacterized membrane protein YczE
MTRFGNLPLRYRPVRRLAALYAGLFLYGGGVSAMVDARLGLDPWDVLHQGISKITGVRLGWIVIAVGVVVLASWIPLRQRPGLGTVSNVFGIGLANIAVSAVLPEPHGLALRWAYGLFAVLAIGVGTGMYIGARYGPGPRDGLMTGLVTRYAGRWFASVRVVRTAIEVTVLVAGYLLGGTVGWITLVFALSIGPLAHVFIPIFTVPDPPEAAPAPAAAPETPAAAVTSDPSPALSTG